MSAASASPAVKRISICGPPVEDDGAPPKTFAQALQSIAELGRFDVERARSAMAKLGRFDVERARSAIVKLGAHIKSKAAESRAPAHLRTTQTRARGAGRPRARTRTSSRGGDSGDSSGSSSGGGELPPPAQLYLVHERYGRVNRALAYFLRSVPA